MSAVTGPESALLKFRAIAASHAGRYVCTAINAVGEARAVAEVLVNGETSILHILSLTQV